MTSSPMPTTQEGPSESPPSLPEGWLAQWEGQSRKYYYVQRATGHSQWDIPTQPALSVPTPDPTPQQTTDPFQQPPNASGGAGGILGPKKDDGTSGEYQGADRSFLSDMAMNAVTGGKQSKPQKQSGLGGIASSLLGGQGSHGGGGHQGGGGGLAGQLVGSLLGGGKPQNQNHSSQHSGGSGGYSGSSGLSSGAHDQGGLVGMASGFLGGHHSSASQSNNYGYSSSGQGSGSGGYSGQAPPTTYQPPGQQSSNQYGSSITQHDPPGQSRPHDTSSHGSNYGGSSDFGQGGHGSSAPTQYGQQNPNPQYNHGQQNQPSPGLPGGQAYPPSGGYGSHPNAFSGPPQGPYGSSTPNIPAYSQQPTSYPPHHQDSNYNAYSGPNQQHQYPPPPPQNPSYIGQQGGYDPYHSPPSVSSPPGQYQHQQPPANSGFPGQQGSYSHANQGGPNYGQSPPPSQGGYGQQGGYGGSGVPPAPGWRA